MQSGHFQILRYTYICIGTKWNVFLIIRYSGLIVYKEFDVCLFEADVTTSLIDKNIVSDFYHTRQQAIFMN